MSFDKRFYGIYQGIVIDTKDPDNRGRITVQVPQVTGSAVTGWVDVCNNSGGGMLALPVYGSFYDTTSQVAAAINTGYPITINTTAEANNISIDPAHTSRIVFSYAGTYNIQFSAQLSTTNSSLQKAQIWLKQNGVAVPQTSGEVTLAGNGAATLPAWNYVLTVSANDYVEFYWATDDTSTRINAAIPSIDGAPGTPSMIVTVTPIGNIVPNPGQTVWIMYIAGDPNFPVWMGIQR